MSLTEIKAEIPTTMVEEADLLLQELGVEGWSLLEDVIAKRAWVVGVFATEAEARSQWATLGPLLRTVGHPVVRALADQDWRDSYKAHFKPWQSGRLHWVPRWEKGTYPLPPGHVALWLDPGLAFGTGNHETTRLCCDRLVAYALTRGTDGRVIDAGCGSGILALSASLLGFRDIVGFDCDREAVRVSQENAELNGMTGKVHFLTADLDSGLAGQSADLVMANIQADVLMRFAGRLVGAVAPGGALVLSGILKIEADKVRVSFATAAPGWAFECCVMGEWCDLLMMRT